MYIIHSFGQSVNQNHVFLTVVSHWFI